MSRPRRSCKATVRLEDLAPARHRNRHRVPYASDGSVRREPSCLRTCDAPRPRLRQRHPDGTGRPQRMVQRGASTKNGPACCPAVGVEKCCGIHTVEWSTRRQVDDRSAQTVVRHTRRWRLSIRPTRGPLRKHKGARLRECSGRVLRALRVSNPRVLTHHLALKR